MTSSPPVVHLREPVRTDNPSSASTTTTTTNPDHARLTLAYLYGTWHVTHSTLPTWRNKQNVRITYSPLSHPESPPASRSSATSPNPFRGPSISTSPHPFDQSPPPPPKMTLAERIVAEEERAIQRQRQRDAANLHVTAEKRQKLEPIIMDDLVQYQALDSTRVKSIHGHDTAVGGDEDDDYAEKLRVWNWRGRGLLFIATSRWQILGFGSTPFRGERSAGDDGDGEESNRWMVTFFEKTLFTPAGLDIYSRDARGVSEELVSEIKATLGKMQDEEVRRLSGELFEVRTDHVGGGEEDVK